MPVPKVLQEQLDRITHAMHAGTYDVATVDDAVKQLGILLDGAQEAPEPTHLSTPIPVPGQEHGATVTSIKGH
jgi:hypothetical protein